MKVILKSLKLKNFLSHENSEITFDENQGLLLDGISGSGKSSLFDGLIWALYGEARSDGRSLIRKSQKTAVVELVLGQQGEDGASTLSRITRTITETGKHTLDVVTWNNGHWTALPSATKTERQQWIEKELIGASYLLFVNSVAYVQGNNDTFIAQTASVRKELLLEILKAENFDSMYEKAKEALTIVSNEKSALDGKLSLLESQIETLDLELLLEGSFLDGRTLLTGSLAKVIERKKEAKEKIEQYKDLNTRIMSLTTAIETIRSEISAEERIESLLWEKVEVKNRFERLIKDEASIVNYVVSSTTQIEVYSKEIKEEEQKEIDFRILQAKEPRVMLNTEKELLWIRNKIHALKEKEPCPSGDLCPYYKNVPLELEELKEKEDRYLNQIDEEKEEYKKWKEKLNNLPRAKDLEAKMRAKTKESEFLLENREKLREITKIKGDLLTMADIEKTYEETRKKIKKLKDEEEQLSGELEEVRKEYEGSKMIHLQDDLTGLEVQERGLNEKVISADLSLLRISQEKFRKKELVIEVDKIKEKKIELFSKEEVLELAKSAFGSKGIKTIAIDYLLPRLEDKVNEVLSRFSEFRIKLDSQRLSLEGKPIEGLFITVINDIGEELPIENLSGGERVKVIIAFAEALATLQKCGFRILDESITALDEDTLEHFLEALANLQSRYPQVLAISHIQAVKDTFPKSIKCVKHNGITRLDKNQT